LKAITDTRTALLAGRALGTFWLNAEVVPGLVEVEVAVPRLMPALR
jgi:hypothetical protein